MFPPRTATTCCAFLSAALLAAALHAWPVAAGDDEPAAAEFSLTLPDSSERIAVGWRQIGADLAAFLEPSGLDGRGLHELRVQALLRQSGTLRVDVPFKVGEQLFEAGERSLGFTVDQGGALRFFLVAGQDALDLPSLPLEPGWDAPRLLLQLVLVDRGEAQLVWHVGTRAGAIVLRLGATADGR